MSDDRAIVLMRLVRSWDDSPAETPGRQSAICRGTQAPSSPGTMASYLILASLSCGSVRGRVLGRSFQIISCRCSQHFLLFGGVKVPRYTPPGFVILGLDRPRQSQTAPGDEVPLDLRSATTDVHPRSELIEALELAHQRSPFRALLHLPI